jgi:NadR type nicotinamide-nucleotide adenylyltransferase
MMIGCCAAAVISNQKSSISNFWRSMTIGFLLGKFLPPHRGHMYLIEQAALRCDRLTVLVCSIQREPIPGSLRYEWVRELYPQHDVQHCIDENPQYPQEHPDFWDIWVGSIRRFVPTGPDLVFSSEDYGEELAARLGARHICIDKARSVVPISGTAVRADPRAAWPWIPPQVQAYYDELGD